MTAASVSGCGLVGGTIFVVKSFVAVGLDTLRNKAGDLLVNHDGC